MKTFILPIIITCCFCVNNIYAQQNNNPERLWKLIENDMGLTNSVYITDSSLYCQLLSFMADTNKVHFANECENYLLDYGNSNLIKKYVKYYGIPWKKYPLFMAVALDTIQPNIEYPLWINVMLNDSSSIDYLITKFVSSNIFSEKLKYLDCLTRINDRKVLSMLIDEYQKNIYYYDRYSYSCYSSRYFLLYWLRHIFNENNLFRSLYKENIQNVNIYYISTNDTEDMPDILNCNKSVIDFINKNVNNNQTQYIKRVESFVNETFGVAIDSQDIGLIWFYYVTEVE